LALDRVHLLAEDLLDLRARALTEGQQAEDPLAHLADVAAAEEDLVARRHRIAGRGGRSSSNEVLDAHCSLLLLALPRGLPFNTAQKAGRGPVAKESPALRPRLSYTVAAPAAGHRT